MKTTSQLNRTMTSGLLCLAALISMATGGCLDQTRTIKEQQTLILEKAEQERRALDNLIKLSMRERQIAECRFDELKADYCHLTKKIDKVRAEQSGLQGRLQSIQNNVNEQFNQSWKEQQRTLTQQQTLLDGMEALSETVTPLPERTLGLERSQQRLINVMDRRLNDVMTELHQVRQKNQQLAQNNTALTLAIQGVAQDVDLVHKRQNALVDLIEVKGTGVNTQLNQLAAQQGQVFHTMKGVKQQTHQIAQGLQQVAGQQDELAQSFSVGAERVTEQLNVIGAQNNRQLAFQRRLNKAMNKANEALMTLQCASTELQALLNETQVEDQEQFALLSEQQQKIHTALNQGPKKISKEIHSAVGHLSEIVQAQHNELTQNLEQGQEAVLSNLATLAQQQGEQAEPIQKILNRIGKLEQHGSGLVEQSEKSGAALSQIKQMLGQAEHLLQEKFTHIQTQQERFAVTLDQTRDRLNSGLHGLKERSSQGDQLLTQLNHRADLLQDQITGFSQQMNTATEALKLQTNALEQHQQNAQTDANLNESVRKGLRSMGKALDQVKDLQLTLQEQLNQIKRELQRKQKHVDPTTPQLEDSPALKEEDPEPK